MDPKRLGAGVLVGGVVMVALGYLFWDVLATDFFAAHQGSATGVGRDAPIWWAVVVGTLLSAALLTLALDWAGVASMGDAFKTGALVGLLVWGGVDLILYGYQNTGDLTSALADAGLEFFRWGIAAVVMTAVGIRGGEVGEAAE